jgi:HAAS
MDTIIDRYLAAVSAILPAKIRTDTVTEIRSLIQDALDDRSKTEGREPDDQMMSEVLKQFGPPEKIVAPYLPEKYLIGPRLFPIFLLVIRISLPIIAVLSLVGFWIAFSQGNQITGQVLLTNIVKSIGEAFSTVVQAFGNIVFIFAILQWVLPELKFPAQEKEWDPHSLKAVSQPDKIKYGELITEIFFNILALIIFNFYLDRIGIYNNLNGVWTFTPVLTSAFNAYIPWLDLLWIMTIILDAILLRKGSWQFGSRVFAILLSGFNISLAARFMTHIQYLYTVKAALGQFGAEGIVQAVLNQVLIVVFIIVIITSAVKILRMIMGIVRGASPQIKGSTSA